MNISQTIKTEYHTVSMKEDMAALADRLMPGHYLVVVNDQQKVLGLITHSDYLKNPTGKIGGCIFPEPKVCPEFKIIETLKLMSGSGKDALPVFKMIYFREWSPILTLASS